MYSVYDLWKNLIDNKESFRKIQSLSEFPYSYSMFSYARNGKGFPNFSIKVNKDNSLFPGGEFIKVKNRNEYLISPFKSEIPTGRINIKTLTYTPSAARLLHEMKAAGDDVFSLEERDVYYLVRGRRKGHQKVCLVHGSFFETINTRELIRQSFAQVLDDKLAGTSVSDEVKEQLGELFSEQADFSRVRNVEQASVKLRFRVMTEVKPEGNILNPKQYPEIVDDSLNFITPYHNEEEKMMIFQRMESAVGKKGVETFKTFSLKHPLNGWFTVFQADL